MRSCGLKSWSKETRDNALPKDSSGLELYMRHCKRALHKGHIILSRHQHDKVAFGQIQRRCVSIHAGLRMVSALKAFPTPSIMLLQQYANNIQDHTPAGEKHMKIELPKKTRVLKLLSAVAPAAGIESSRTARHCHNSLRSNLHTRGLAH